jgi:hypothetical protein
VCFDFYTLYNFRCEVLLTVMEQCHSHELQNLIGYVVEQSSVSDCSELLFFLSCLVSCRSLGSELCWRTPRRGADLYPHVEKVGEIWSGGFKEWWENLIIAVLLVKSWFTNMLKSKAEVLEFCEHGVSFLSNSIFPFQAVPLTKSSTRNASTVSQLSSRKGNFWFQHLKT